MKLKITMVLAIILLLFGLFVSFNWIKAQKQTKSSQPINWVSSTDCSNQKSDPKIMSNVSYTGANGSELLADVYVPAGTCLPAILLIHGGGFVAGDKQPFEIVAKELVKKGFVVVNSNYTLARANDPKTVYPAAIKDLQTLLKLMRQKANTFNIDSKKIAAMGASSGGNYALMLGTTGTKGEDRVDAVVSWSGPLNLELMYKNRDIETSVDPIKAITQYLGCSYDSCSEKWKDASPSFKIDNLTAPVFMANSISEAEKPMGMPLSQLEDAESRLKNAGVRYKAIKVPGDAHAFFPGLLDETVNFLNKELNPPK